MKKFVEEFKEFISKGNVFDMAVGIIVGGAFTTIVGSLVDDILMPFIGWLIGGMNFSAYAIQLSENASINYGAFIQNIINFLIIAFVVFLMVKAINKMRRQKEEEPAPEEPSEEVKLLTEIRDALKEEK